MKKWDAREKKWVWEKSKKGKKKYIYINVCYIKYKIYFIIYELLIKK